MFIIQALGISKEGRDRQVLSDLDLAVAKGTCVGIVGETGAGKTSLLQILGGRGQASSGTVLFKGRNVPGTSEKLVPGHPGIGFLSQHFELPPHYWVHELLSYAGDLSNSERQYLYALCRIAHLTERRSSQLSGGERQRVALARELLHQPDLLLLDEPFNNLDGHNKRTIRQVLADLRTQWGITQIMVSHEAQDMLSWADQLYIMKEGRWVQSGEPKHVYEQPVNVYAAGLLGEYSLIDPSHPAFIQLPFDKVPGQNWLIRPEDIKPVSADHRQLTGYVEKTEFRGSFYAATLRVERQSLLMFSLAPTVQPGDSIDIRIERVVGLPA